MSKLNESKKAIYIILGMMFLLLLVCNILTPYIADDFNYLHSFATGERIKNFGDIISSMKAHAQSMNGRLVAHSFVQIFSLFPTWFFDVVNSCMFVLQIFLMYLICRKDKKNNVLMLILIICLIWIYEPAFGQVNLWFDGACNYLWCVVFGMLFTLPFVYDFLYDRVINNKFHQIIYIIISFIAGAYLENGSAPFIFVCLVITFLLKFYQHKKVKIYQLISLVVSFMGYISIYLAPAEWAHKHSSGGMGMLRENFIRALNMYMYLKRPLIILIVSLLIAVTIKVDIKKIILSLLFLIGSLCSNFMLVVASDHPGRCMICPIILLILSSGVLFEEIFSGDYKVFLTSMIAILAVFATYYVILAVNDIYVTYNSIKANETYILECKEKGEMDISIPMVVAQTKYSAIHGLRYLATDTPDNWPNDSIAKYYEIDTVIGR